MTIDDESSIYVGGIPYDSTEDSLRRIFDIYGSVLAVKIINDRNIGGKCYAFVTFTNPRSAMHAINEMDGQTVDGRVVRVNEVRSRAGRSNFGRDSFRRNLDRGIDGDRGRSRERVYDHDRDRYRDDFREHSREHHLGLERGYDDVQDHDRMRDRHSDRERVHDHDHDDLDDVALEHERIRDYNWERVRDMDKEIQRTTSHHKASEQYDEVLKITERSYSNEHGKRDRSSESSDDDRAEVSKKLEISNHKSQELQKEIARMEELAEEKKLLLLKLQEKSKKLEDSLNATKRDKSYREMQLAKLNKCYLQVRDCNERLKLSEQELQSLVSSTMSELEHGTGMGARDGILKNGCTN